MHDAPGIGRIERVGELDRHLHYGIHVERALAQQGLECQPLDILHGQIRLLVAGLTHVVDHAHVGVIQRRGRPGLGQKTLTQLAIFRPVRPQELQSHLPLQLVVVGEIDQAEAAFSQDFLDAVATDELWQRFGNGINGELFFAARLVSACSFGVIHGSCRPSPTDSAAAVASHGFLADRGLRSRTTVTERLPKVMEEGAFRHRSSRGTFKLSGTHLPGLSGLS